MPGITQVNTNTNGKEANSFDAIVIGSGIRLLDKLDRKIFKVEVVEVHERPEVIHTKYRVINKIAKVEKEAMVSEVRV